MLWGQKTTSRAEPMRARRSHWGDRVRARIGAVWRRLAAICVAAALTSSSAALAQMAGSSNASPAQPRP